MSGDLSAGVRCYICPAHTSGERICTQGDAACPEFLLASQCLRSCFYLDFLQKSTSGNCLKKRTVGVIQATTWMCP